MKIMCIKTKKLPSKITNVKVAPKEDIFDIVNNSNICWIERSLAEKVATYKQFIPYILLRNEDRLFACYQRHGAEIRLHDKYSAGIEGYVDEPDNQNNTRKTIETCMFRGEELSNFQKDKIDLKCLRIINEVESEEVLCILD